MHWKGRNTRDIVEYAKINPYSVYSCPENSPEEVEAKVLRFLNEPEPYENKYEIHILPMMVAEIIPDEIVPEKNATVTGRLDLANGRIAAAGPILTGHELWDRLLEAATDCAIRYLVRLGPEDPGFADLFRHRVEINEIGNLLREERKMSKSLMDLVTGDSGIPAHYKSILKAWPVAAEISTELDRSNIN